MSNFVKTMANRSVSAIAALGSLFVRRDADGRVSIALAPLSVVLMLGTSVTCGVQKSEPYSACVKDTVHSLKELIYAN